MRLEQARVLVTGGAKRIGSKICEKFADEGAKIIVHFNKSADAASKLASKLGGEKNGHSILRCDFSKYSEVRKIMKTLPPFDILVNNASIYAPETILQENEPSIRKKMSINFFAPLFLSLEFAKKCNGRGHIINILDERVARLANSEGSYELSKKCLWWATETLAIQLAPRIRVNAVAPGAVLPPEANPDFTMSRQKIETPLRMTATPEDVASACIYLAKNDSITGQIIFVDGGRHLHG